MDRWQGRVALVTGASAGIGAALVRKLTSHGIKVVGCARRVDFIETMAKANPLLFAYKCDVTDFAALDKMFDWIEAHPDLGQVDICVANAGIIETASLLEASPERFVKCLNVNVVSVQHCFKLATNLMIKKGVKEGQLMVTGSVAGNKVNPTIMLYSVSKAAVNALVEAWRLELKAKGLDKVKVSCICPGPVKTDFFTTETSSDLIRKATQDGPAQIGLLGTDDVLACFELALALPPSVEVRDIVLKHLKSP